MLIKLDKSGLNFYSRAKVEDSNDIHDQVSSAYHGELSKSLQIKTKKRIDWIIDQVEAGPVLDVGCSQGIIPILLGRSGYNVTGIDLDANSLGRARKDLQAEDKKTNSRVSFVLENFLELEFDDDSRFETIVFTEILEHLFLPELFLKRAFEIGENKSKLIITVPFGINDFPDHKQNFYLAELYSMVSKYFDIEKVEFIEKWVGLVAIKKNEIGLPQDLDRSLIEDLEDNFYKVERASVNLNYILKDKLKLKQQLQQKQIVSLTNELSTIRKSIPYTLGKIISLPIESIAGLLKYLFLSAFSQINKWTLNKPILVSGDCSQRMLSLPPEQPIIFKLDEVENIVNGSLKIAMIADEFTSSAYGHDATLLELTPENWGEEIEGFLPDLIFIESAWKGKDDKWRKKVESPSSEILGLLRKARSLSIPTVFWNKEDPAHTDAFLKVASYCDFVFTTDADSIGLYKEVLQHNNVFLLPFAMQPMISNPIEEFERAEKVSFAGSYYQKYKERSKDFSSMVRSIVKIFPVVIYDRNSERNLGPAYHFPSEFDGLIRPSLPFSEISKANKGYLAAINVNTVKYSSTMFARRCFELLASNTLAISNYSKGMNNILGDLVITSDDLSQVHLKLKNSSSVHRLVALRTVLSEHTYKDRLLYLCSKVFENVNYEGEKLPSVSVLAKVDSLEELTLVKSMLNDQFYKSFRIKLFSTTGFVYEGENIELETVVFDSVQESDSSYFVVINPNNSYGKNYILDLLLATKYIKNKFIGKGSYGELKKGQVVFKNEDLQYRDGVEISIDMGLIPIEVMKDKIKEGISLKVLLVEKIEGFSIDKYSILVNQKCNAVNLKFLKDYDGELNLNIPKIKAIYETYNDECVNLKVNNKLTFLRKYGLFFQVKQKSLVKEGGNKA